MRLIPPRPQRRRQAEPIVPMINVVFLLLIFFLMSAQIAPPDPFEMELPQAAGDPAENAGQPLFLARDGTLAFGELRGPEALQAAAAQDPVTLHAHAEAEAKQLAGALRALSELGAEDIRLVTEEPRR